MSNILELTRELVSIPSWVGMGCDEIKVGQFIYDWLSANTKLKVIKQPVVGGRFNIIATDDSPTRIILAGHIDTVEVSTGWTTNPFVPTIKNDRLYGRGSSDMKGSLAAMLVAISEVKDTKGLMVLCYIDEEYDFAGMKVFISEYGMYLKPELVVSLDGYISKIGTGCRGLIEVSFKLLGKTGHAGRPEQGVNAILTGVSCINKLKRRLATKYSDPILGITTLNLAYVQGGLNLGPNTYGRQGNNIANIAEFVLDIRPASPKLNASTVESILNKYAQASKLEMIDFKIRHNLGAWISDYKDMEKTLDLPGNPETFGGYVDTQMIWEACNQPTCLAIGAATSSMAHATDEYVEIEDLETTYKNVKNILNKYTK